MTKEISKGTQKFIWHLTTFVAVFVLILMVLSRVIPEPVRTSNVNQSQQASVTEKAEYSSTDFDSVKERVDAANNTTGKEIKDLYSSEGKSTMQKQLETRLFFNTVKSILICVLLVVVIIVLLKKGLNFKKIKKILDGNEPEEDKPVQEPVSAETGETALDVPERISEATDEEPMPDEEPPLEEEKEPDEEEVAENCKL